jgi:hypothetical protein
MSVFSTQKYFAFEKYMMTNVINKIDINQNNDESL